MLHWFTDCPPVGNTFKDVTIKDVTISDNSGQGIFIEIETAPDYHLDEASFGYAEQQRADEHANHIKAQAAERMIAADVPREAAKAIADAAKGYADDLRHDVEAISRREGQEWDVTPKRQRAIGEGVGPLVGRVVGE
jgi:hypothetical protein